MASTYGYPVGFWKEGNVWTLAAHVTFGATGVPTLDTKNSKGICSFQPQSVVFSGATVSSSATITSVSSFLGLYTGMALTGTGFQTNTTIGTVSAATGSLVLNKVVVTGSSTGSLALFASGGRYVMQFGQQAAQRLDSYVKLLYLGKVSDVTSASASGGVGVAALAPAAPNMFLVANNSSVRTIPATTTSGSTDCSLSLQFGTGIGTGFVAADPVAGEGMRLVIGFGNLSAGPGVQ